MLPVASSNPNLTLSGRYWTVPEKIETGGVDDMEFLGVLKKKTCGNSSGQLKRKWKFQGCSKK